MFNSYTSYSQASGTQLKIRATYGIYTVQASLENLKRRDSFVYLYTSYSQAFGTQLNIGTIHKLRLQNYLLFIELEDNTSSANKGILKWLSQCAGPTSKPEGQQCTLTDENYGYHTRTPSCVCCGSDSIDPYLPSTSKAGIESHQTTVQKRARYCVCCGSTDSADLCLKFTSKVGGESKQTKRPAFMLAEKNNERQKRAPSCVCCGSNTSDASNKKSGM